MPKGYTYILKCADGSYYTGSTKDLELRLAQHQAGEGANHTRKHLPVELVYWEEHPRIDHAFYREKQIQGWSRKKKEALISGQTETLNGLAECRNETHFKNRASAPLSPQASAPLRPGPLTERSRSQRALSAAHPTSPLNRPQSRPQSRPLSGAEGEGKRNANATPGKKPKTPIFEPPANQSGRRIERKDEDEEKHLHEREE